MVLKRTIEKRFIFFRNSKVYKPQSIWVLLGTSLLGIVSLENSIRFCKIIFRKKEGTAIFSTFVLPRLDAKPYTL
jgi:RsiW-degrading membrane proteinase PrsW (M82 family)